MRCMPDPQHYKGVVCHSRHSNQWAQKGPFRPDKSDQLMLLGWFPAYTPHGTIQFSICKEKDAFICVIWVMNPIPVSVTQLPNLWVWLLH